ncbi:MAG: hypothetical protein WCN88_03310 [Candidatus Falkowbacteria bacterium]
MACIITVLAVFTVTLIVILAVVNYILQIYAADYAFMADLYKIVSDLSLGQAILSFYGILFICAMFAFGAMYSPERIAE